MRLPVSLFLAPVASLVAQAPATQPPTSDVQVQVRQGRVLVHLPSEGVTVLGTPASAKDDQGAASFDQRMDLLWKGEMTDSQGRRYNVRILPGYVWPLEKLQEGWSEAGEDLAEYGQARIWNTMGRHSRDAFKWGWKKSAWEFGLKGSGKAWQQRFQRASQRTARRSFGWPLAYPWAFVASTFESALRIPVGAVGAAMGTAGGVVIPVVETAWPTAKAVYHAGVEGTALPLASWSWQTVAGPMGAAFASAPRPSRADGTWMRLEVPRHQSASRPLLPDPSPQTLDTLEAFSRAAHAALEPLDARLTAHQQQLKAELEAARARYTAATEALQAERSAALEAWLAAPAQREALVQAFRQVKTSQAFPLARTQVRKRLVDSGLSEQAADRALGLLVVQEDTSLTRSPAKTDPVLSALETTERVLGRFPR